MQRINFIDQRCGHPSGKSASHNADYRGGKLASVHASRQINQRGYVLGSVLAGDAASVCLDKPATRSRRPAVCSIGTLAGVLEVKPFDFQAYWSSIDSPNCRASCCRRSFMRRRSSKSHSTSKSGDRITRKKRATYRWSMGGL